MSWLHLSPERICRFSAVLAWLACCATATRAEQQFPYVAYIANDGAYVRSGPGQRHYPTGQLQQGYAVHVYRHDGKGWCAIRPPEESFSWVAAHEVRTLNESLAEVVSERAVARVGSRLSPTRSAVQVMIPLGEKVAIVPSQPNDDPRWLRIKAPAGEFRWVAAEHLSLRPPMEVPPQPNSTSKWTQATNVSEQPQSHPSAITNAFSHLQVTTSNSLPIAPNGVSYARPAATPLPPQTYPNAIEVIAGSPAAAQLAQYQATQEAVTIPSPSTAQPLLGHPGVPQTPLPRVHLPDAPAKAVVSETVDELEILLSQTVAQSHENWRLDSLRAEVELQMRTTTSAAERVQLRDLHGRILQFQRLQMEHQVPFATPLPKQDSVAQTTAEVPTTAEPESELEPVDQLQRVVANVRKRVESDLRRDARPPSHSSNESTNNRFDAIGKLKPVVSKREHAPPFALVDEKGKVVSFVTPTPDLNLQPYVGRRIGIHGNRGYMPEYHRAHITAGRVLPVENIVRR